MKLRYFSLKLEAIRRSPLGRPRLNFVVSSRLLFIRPIRAGNFVAFEVLDGILVVQVVVVERFRSRELRVFSANVSRVLGN